MRLTVQHSLLTGTHTVLNLDCGHSLAYSGGPDQANNQLRQARGTIGHGGFTRCYDCSQAFINTLAEVLRENFPVRT